MVLHCSAQKISFHHSAFLMLICKSNLAVAFPIWQFLLWSNANSALTLQQWLQHVFSSNQVKCWFTNQASLWSKSGCAGTWNRHVMIWVWWLAAWKLKLHDHACRSWKNIFNVTWHFQRHALWDCHNTFCVCHSSIWKNKSISLCTMVNLICWTNNVDMECWDNHRKRKRESFSLCHPNNLSQVSSEFGRSRWR